MITTSDSFNTIDLGKYYAILQCDGTTENRYRDKKIEITRVEQGFTYNSGTNIKFMSIDEIRKEIKKNIDNNFKPR